MEKKLERYELIKSEIARLGLIKKGNVTRNTYVCGTPNCKCKKNRKFRHGPYFLLSWKVNNVTKSMLLPVELVPLIKGYKKNYQKMKKLTDKMDQTAGEIIKEKIKSMK
jgi:hypothetical protein